MAWLTFGSIYCFAMIIVAKAYDWGDGSIIFFALFFWVFVGLYIFVEVPKGRR